MLGRTILARLTALLLAVLAVVPQAATAQDAETVPQSATIDDMEVFEPYIGRFRSDDKVFDNSEVRYHYEIDYRWFDRDHAIVSYALFLVVPERERRLDIGNGFYYLDRAGGRIGVFGAFRDGRIGAGSMGEFDRETHERTVWVTGVAPDGTQTMVRDHFELAGDGRWRNATYVRAAGEEWRQISSDLFTRIEDGGESG